MVALKRCWVAVNRQPCALASWSTPGSFMSVVCQPSACQGNSQATAPWFSAGLTGAPAEAGAALGLGAEVGALSGEAFCDAAAAAPRTESPLSRVLVPSAQELSANNPAVTSAHTATNRLVVY